MSEEVTRIFLDIAPEFQHLLNDNGISVAEILREKNIPAEVTYGILPDESEREARSKDPALIILASSAAVMGISLAISQVFRTLQHKPQLVQYYEFVEVKDATGNVLLDTEGKPQLKRAKKHELLEPREEKSSRSFEINLNPANGLVIKFESAENQTGTQEKPTPVSRS